MKITGRSNRHGEVAAHDRSCVLQDSDPSRVVLAQASGSASFWATVTDPVLLEYQVVP